MGKYGRIRGNTRRDDVLNFGLLTLNLLVLWDSDKNNLILVVAGLLRTGNVNFVGSGGL
jgi:hypothetical protein